MYPIATLLRPFVGAGVGFMVGARSSLAPGSATRCWVGLRSSWSLRTAAGGDRSLTIASDPAATVSIVDREYILSGHECLIGRAPDCHIRVEKNDLVSRTHGSIRREGEVYVFYDQSLNGTYINGQLVQSSRRILINRDVIGLANSIPMFQFLDLSDTTTEVVLLAEPLSERELEVLRLVARGLYNEDIGKQLSISIDTVKTHLRHIYDKLAVHNRVEAITRAGALGLLQSRNTFSHLPK